MVDNMKIAIIALAILILPYMAYEIRKAFLAVGREILITDMRKALVSDLSLSESDREFIAHTLNEIHNGNVNVENINRAEQLIYR
jgi:hypothetical protein